MPESYYDEEVFRPSYVFYQLVCVDGQELSTRAMPCGALLLPVK